MKRQRNLRNIDRVVRWAIRLFRCDTARVIAPIRKKFLVIGWNKRSEGQWISQDGKPQNFNYAQESVIASGFTWDSLQNSARRYKLLLKANVPHELRANAGPQNKEGRKHEQTN